MFELSAIERPKDRNDVKTQSPIQRLTAFWAFSEAGFGGVLHITRLPFKGIFIAGAATLFISLIAKFSTIRGVILRSTIIVIVLKFLISPHTPFTAAIAVFAQGIIGELFFFSKKFTKVVIPTFSMFIQLITAVQKILIITILFGQNFWITIDDFANSLLNQIITADRVEFSFLIIAGYIVIHVLAGLFLGLYILRLSKYLKENNSDSNIILNEVASNDVTIDDRVEKRKWFKKPSGIVTMIFFIAVLSVSFFIPDWMKSDLTDILFMIVRAIIIVTVWYFFVSPILMKIFSKIISNQKSKHFEEVNSIIQLFPQMKQVVKMSWKKSKSIRGVKRMEIFISNLIRTVLKA